MTELETALELLKREINKHEIDLRRAEQRNGARAEELQSLRDKIAQKSLIVAEVTELEQKLDSYKRVLRDKLVENATLRAQLKMLTKGADADGQKRLEPAK